MPRGILTLLCLLLAASATLSAAGCKAAGPAPTSGEPVIDDFGGTWAEAGSANIPGIFGLERTGGKLASDSMVFPGDELARSEGVTSAGGVMSLEAPPGGMAWAIWGWRELDYENNYPTGATIVQSDPGGEYWLGVADFTRYQWRFAGPFSGAETQVDLGPVSPLRASLRGIGYLAIVCYGGGAAHIESLTLETGAYVSQGMPAPWWTNAANRFHGEPGSVYVYWQKLDCAQRYEILKWKAGQDPSLAAVITTYSPQDPHHPGEQIKSTNFDDYDVDAGAYYQYRVVAVGESGSKSTPGPVAAAFYGDSEGRFGITGNILHSDGWGIPVAEIYLAELDLYSSTQLDGYFWFADVPRGSYNLWLTSSEEPQHIQLVQVVDSNAYVQDFEFSPDSVPPLHWYWLQPPAQVDAALVGDNDAQITWSAAPYAEEYILYRESRIDPESILKIHQGPETSFLAENEPSGEFGYVVQSINSDDSPWYRSPFSAAALLTIPFQGIQPDSLYAIPEKTTATPGEHVRVTVYTNLAGSTFQFMNGCRITYESENSIIFDTLNVGAPGGEQYYPDGVWAQVDPKGGFFALPESLLQELDLGNGRKAFGYNLTPFGGHDIEQATGALFNFEIEVHSDVNFSFIGVQDTMRTYYSDGASWEHLWHDFYNYGQPGITLVDE